jgi:hypothetical protein
MPFAKYSSFGSRLKFLIGKIAIRSLSRAGFDVESAGGTKLLDLAKSLGAKNPHRLAVHLTEPVGLEVFAGLTQAGTQESESIQHDPFLGAYG